MRALFLTFAAIGLLTTSAPAQNRDIDISAFIRNTSQAGTLIQDPAAPISFQLAPGWSLKNGIRWGDHESTLWFVEAASGITVALYYQSPLHPPFPGDAAAALRQGMEAKVLQRQRDNGISDYRVLPDSIQTRQVGGQPALSFIAQFTNSGGNTVGEYMVRVLGKSTKAHFFVVGIPANDISAFCRRLDPITESLRIP